MRITVDLDGNEGAALVKLAQRERRHPRAQAAIVIRYELERLGLLKEADSRPDLRPQPREEARHV